MKKNLILMALLFLAILSCEKDDICIEDTTPNLVLRFYDNENQTEVKQITDLTVWAINYDSIYVNESLDSIAAPLDLNQNATTYILVNNLVNDTITFSYDRNDIFVSRSCGYKTTFDNMQIESNTTNWIKNININNTLIDNDTTAHITIFH
ncbi:MAG: hypothetical protein HKP59_01060 [Lutibacter sp.]|uniref:DUF6452 family protein n=1 Tax=Lutibacter sp. TaxID=1925666 RepID=UPI0017D62BE8|nr:DUF6452 family protein [Lutibacter sp.]MBT8316195.1 hypothetical protein [Lutibacter sp.]NNJ57055.1 hypothetical protein [Lutibacter sp.]